MIVFETLVILVFGFILTDKILKTIYENFGIRFTGDVWVNWFAVSYLLFFLYTFIRCLFINKHHNLFKKRISSIIFWLLLIGAIYAVFIPFVIGENPF